MERRRSDRKKTLELADLYVEQRFVQLCLVSCVSPTGVFVQDTRLPRFVRGTRVDLYFAIDQHRTRDNKLLRLRGVIARVCERGAGVRVFSKQLPEFAFG